MVDQDRQSVLLETFCQEILRWNRQINLVTRQETADHLESLLSQCRAGVPVVEKWLAEQKDPAKIWYFDLGSGGGLPGVVWHLFLSEKYAPHTVLVEPREKRAWFLERLARLPEMPSFKVINDRWGEGPVEIPDKAPGAVVVSLKALRLSDDEILAGLARFFGSLTSPPRVLIARYYPPGQAWSQQLADNLSIPEPGRRVAWGEGSLISQDSGAISLSPQAGASLVVSSYRSG